jgi:hypothetical protein
MQYQRGSIKLFFRGDPTLKGYWNLDGNPRDESGSNYHGTVTGASVVPMPRNRFKGNYLSYLFKSASSQYINCGNVPVPSGNKLTVLLWLRINTVQNQWIVAKDTDTGRSFAFGLSSTKKFWSQINGLGGTSTDNVEDIQSAKIYLLAYVYDGVDVLYYINGKRDGKNNFGVTINSTATEFDIGRRAYPASESYFDGILFQIGYFHRALSPTEISAYYNWAIRKRQSFYASIFYTPSLVAKIFQAAYDQFSFIGKTSLWAKDQRNFIGRTILFAKDMKNFIGKITSSTFEILGLAAAAAKIKAIVRDIKVRFRIRS